MHPFQVESSPDIKRIVVFSLVFHLGLVLVIFLWFKFRPKPEVIHIPIFEMVQIQEPAPIRPITRPRPQPTPPPEVKPEPKPELKPEPKPDPRPEPKPEPKPEVMPEPQPEVVPETPPQEQPQETPATPPATQPVMELPDFDDMARLRTVESIIIDPLMQVYLERLQLILMQNFNPPAGMDIRRGARTTVQFTIQRNGEITAILLKNSSGNSVWDRLAVRAVTISRLPPLPPNYRAPILPLVFDFKEK